MMTKSRTEVEGMERALSSKDVIPKKRLQDRKKVGTESRDRCMNN